MDLANIDLGRTKQGLVRGFQSNPHSRRFFTLHPVNFIPIYEIFLVPPVGTLDMLYDLSRLHPDSGVHIVFAANRAENGDFVGAAVMNKLLQVGGASGKAVLLSMDERQRAACMQMLAPAAICSSSTSVEGVLEALSYCP